MAAVAVLGADAYYVIPVRDGLIVEEPVNFAPLSFLVAYLTSPQLHAVSASAFVAQPQRRASLGATMQTLHSLFATSQRDMIAAYVDAAVRASSGALQRNDPAAADVTLADAAGKCVLTISFDANGKVAAVK